MAQCSLFKKKNFQQIPFLKINLENGYPSVEEAIANFQIALENAQMCGTKILKVVHGYGSHGAGGLILQEFKKIIASLKRRGQIKNYISGVNWNLSNPEVFKIVLDVPECAQDEDLNCSNMGVTFLVL